MTHLSHPATPDQYKNNSWVGRGVFNRVHGLNWVRDNAEPNSILYFADDDNTYDVRLFDEMRLMKNLAAVWPVGLVLNYGISSPIVFNGKVIGFHDAFQVIIIIITFDQLSKVQLMNAGGKNFRS